MAGKVDVTVRRRGLVIQLLTDKVFFASGEATLNTEATDLVEKIGGIVRDERSHPVIVEGYTDSDPISTARYQSNWSLSGARASAVVKDFARVGVLANRCPCRDTAARSRSKATPRPKAVREPAGGDRPLAHPHRHGVNSLAHGGAKTMVKKIVPVIVLLAVLGAGYKFVLAKPARRASQSRTSWARSTCSRRSSWSTSPTAASRRCRSAWSSRRRRVAIVAAGGEGAATPPEGYGTMAQEGIVRDVITDVLTDATDKDLIDPKLREGLKGRCSRQSRSRPM